MRPRPRSAHARLLALALTFVAALGCTLARVELAGDLIIEDTTVIDVRNGTRVPHQTVVIEENQIVAIVTAETRHSLQADEVIDGVGTFLIPGLWDSHVHAAATRTLEPFYLQLLAHGVTGIRDTWGNLAADRGVAEAIASGEVLGPPRRVIAGNLVDGPSPVWPGSNVAADAEQARAVVDQLYDEGAAFIKVYSKLSREAYFAIGQRATEHGIPFAGHIPLAVTVEEAAEAGQRSVEHLTQIAGACTTQQSELRNAWFAYYGSDRASGQRGLLDRTRAEYDEPTCRDLFQLLVEQDVWQVPTLITLRGQAFLEELAAAGDERLRYLSQSTTFSWVPSRQYQRPEAEIAAAQAMFVHELALVDLMDEVGVPLLAGSDTPNPWAFPGSGLHDELALLVEAGLTPLAALQTATLAPAAFFHREAELGTVEVGKLADLVLLEADPLDDIENVRKIRAVIADGRLHHRADLDVELEALATRLARPSIATWVREALESAGAEAARKGWNEARELGPETVNLDESELNTLGYDYLQMGRVDEAIAVFEMNRDLYPETANVYDSLGDGLKAAGRTEDARSMYAKAVSIAEANGDPDSLLSAFRANLESVSQN